MLQRRPGAKFGQSKWTGWLAWVLWSSVHLLSITGFKNRLMVGINWVMRYFTYEKANRLIIRKFEPENVPVKSKVTDKNQKIGIP